MTGGDSAHLGSSPAANPRRRRVPPAGAERQEEAATNPPDGVLRGVSGRGSDHLGRARGGEAGYVLLLVLWSVGILALLLSQTVGSGRAALREAAARRDHAIAAAAADGGVFLGIFRLFDTEIAEPAPFRTRIGNADVTVSFEDETRKINPNLAGPHLLSALLRVLGVDPPRAAALAADIVDWRTSSAGSSAGGLKIERYRTAGLDHGPGARLFRSIDELGLVPGMTPELVARLRPHLCLYLDSPADPRVASALVAQALTEAEMDVSAPGDLVFPVPQRVVTVRTVTAGTGRVVFSRTAIVGLARGGDSGARPARILTWEGR